MFSLRDEQRFYEQNYYGGYCNQARQNGLEPIPYYRFVDELRNLLDKNLRRKERMAELIVLTRAK